MQASRNCSKEWIIRPSSATSDEELPDFSLITSEDMKERYRSVHATQRPSHGSAKIA